MSGDTGRGRRPNLVLLGKRQARGWGRGRAAGELRRLWQEHYTGAPEIASIIKTIRRHETGEVQVRDEIYRKLYCLAYESSPQELFGTVESTSIEADAFSVRFHKFMPVYVGSEAAQRFIGQRGLKSAPGQWLETFELAESRPAYSLYVWPFGVVIFHVVEHLEFPNLASLAVDRNHEYRDRLAWVAKECRDLMGVGPITDPYVLGCYWLTRPAWPADTLETALRIMCMPKVLLDRGQEASLERAQLVERSLLAEGFDHPEMASFGIKGISYGYASWSGVVYHPVAPERALHERELVACELATQALWAFCAYINSVIEKGHEPRIDPEWGWRFLRACRSRLVNARPQETAQHRSMRNAVLETSGIVGHLTHAIEAIREIEES